MNSHLQRQVKLEDQKVIQNSSRTKNDVARENFIMSFVVPLFWGRIVIGLQGEVISWGEDETGFCLYDNMLRHKSS